MTAAEGHQADTTDGEDPFAQRAEELYESIAFEEDGVDSESASALVAAVATYLELEVTEAQTTEALQEVSPAKENRLSKDEFMRLSESLRAQTPETAGTSTQATVGTAIPVPPSSKRVAADRGITTAAAAKRPRVEEGSAVTTPESSSSKRVADESGVIPTPAEKKHA